MAPQLFSVRSLRISCLILGTFVALSLSSSDTNERKIIAATKRMARNNHKERILGYMDSKGMKSKKSKKSKGSKGPSRRNKPSMHYPDYENRDKDDNSICLDGDLETCLGDAATCEMYESFTSKNYCPNGEEFGSSRNRYTMFYEPHQDIGLDKFLCPCDTTLKKYFDKVISENYCVRASYSYNGEISDYKCHSCDRKCPYRKSGHRKLETSSYTPYYQLNRCTCGQIADSAIENFCIDFVGGNDDYGGYKRSLGAEEGDKLLVDYYYGNYHKPLCTECVHDCMHFVSGCCGATLCRAQYPVSYKPTNQAY